MQSILFYCLLNTLKLSETLKMFYLKDKFSLKKFVILMLNICHYTKAAISLYWNIGYLVFI